MKSWRSSSSVFPAFCVQILLRKWLCKFFICWRLCHYFLREKLERKCRGKIRSTVQQCRKESWSKLKLYQHLRHTPLVLNLKRQVLHCRKCNHSVGGGKVGIYVKCKIFSLQLNSLFAFRGCRFSPGSRRRNLYQIILHIVTAQLLRGICSRVTRYRVRHEDESETFSDEKGLGGEKAWKAIKLFFFIPMNVIYLATEYERQ